MGFLSKLSKKQKPVAPPGVVGNNSMGQRPMRQQSRPSLIVGGPAYFTPEGYEAPRQPEQAFMPTDRMPDPIGEQFRRERPTLPPMPPAITGTDLGLPMNPGIPAPGGVEMGQPFQLPGGSPIGDIPPSFLDFYAQQGMGNVDIPPLPENDYFGDIGQMDFEREYGLKDFEPLLPPPPVQTLADIPWESIRRPAGGTGIPYDALWGNGLKPQNPTTPPVALPPISQAIAGRTPGQFSVDPKDDRGSFDPVTALGATPETISGGGGGFGYNPETGFTNVERDTTFLPPISHAIAGRTPGQYSVDPKDDRSGFDPRSIPPDFLPPIGGGGFPPSLPDRPLPPSIIRTGHGMSPMEEQEAFASGQDVVYTNTEGPAQRFRGLPTQAEMEQLNAGNASPVTPEQEAPPIEQIEQIKQIIPQLPPEQLQEVLPQLPPEVIEQIKSQLPPEIIQQLQLFNPQVSMPSPMMPASAPMMPAPPAMMPRQTPNPNRRIMNPRFPR